MINNPFAETAEKNRKEANLWMVARIIAGIILVLTIILI